LTVGMLGDLKYGRTVHSLAEALSLFDTHQVFISPDSLRMPETTIDELNKKGASYEQSDELTKVESRLDVLYVTRIQKERFVDFQEYERVAGAYRIGRNELELLGEQCRVMHPLPRVDEISESVDSTENAIYFRQAHNGIPTRQALMGLVTGAIK